MKFNLCIDRGNTRTKVALFRGDELLTAVAAPSLAEVDFTHLLAGVTPSAAIFSGVAGDDNEPSRLLHGIVDTVLNVKNVSRLPIRIGYRSPQSLGTDRVAAAVAAATLFPDSDVLIVDAGSALTIDVLTADGTFLGGRISPGMMMRFRALHLFSGRLPMIQATGDVPAIGYDTQTSIRTGVVMGRAGKISQAADYYRDTYHSLRVAATGGDARLLARWLPSEVVVDEHLLAKGLNRILLYNENI